MLKHVALRLTPGCRTPQSDAFGFVPDGSMSMNHVHCKCHPTWGQSFLSAASLETLLCNLTYLWYVAQSCHLLYTAGDATPSNLEEVTITVGALTANNHNQPAFYANVRKRKGILFAIFAALVLYCVFILKRTSNLFFYGSSDQSFLNCQFIKELNKESQTADHTDHPT